MNFANVKALTIPEGNVKQIADGQGTILWKKAAPPLKISSITNPAVGTSSITGDRTATMTRDSARDDDTFTVYYTNFDRSKYTKIKVTYTVVFGSVMMAAYAVSNVVFNGLTTVSQATYAGETKTGDFNITPSGAGGSITVKITNGMQMNYRNTIVTVDISIQAI